MAWQRHGGTVTRAQPRGIVTPGTVYDHCDGLWSDEPGRAMLLLTADCMPIAIARSDGRPPRRRDPARGLARPARRHRGRGRPRDRRRASSQPSIGPSIGPCCYEVGEEVAAPFREAFGDDVVRDGTSSISGRRPSAPCARRASSTSTASTCARLRRRPFLLAPPRPRPHGTPGSHRLRHLTHLRERYERAAGRGRRRRDDRRRDEVRLGRRHGGARATPA